MTTKDASPTSSLADLFDAFDAPKPTPTPKRRTPKPASTDHDEADTAPHTSTEDGWVQIGDPHDHSGDDDTASELPPVRAITDLPMRDRIASADAVRQLLPRFPVGAYPAMATEVGLHGLHPVESTEKFDRNNADAAGAAAWALIEWARSGPTDADWDAIFPSWWEHMADRRVGPHTYGEEEPIPPYPAGTPITYRTVTETAPTPAHRDPAWIAAGHPDAGGEFTSAWGLLGSPDLARAAVMGYDATPVLADVPIMVAVGVDAEDAAVVADEHPGSATYLPTRGVLIGEATGDDIDPHIFRRVAHRVPDRAAGWFDRLDGPGHVEFGEITIDHDPAGVGFVALLWDIEGVIRSVAHLDGAAVDLLARRWGNAVRQPVDRRPGPDGEVLDLTGVPHVRILEMWTDVTVDDLCPAAVRPRSDAD